MKNRLIANVEDETWKSIRIIGISKGLTIAQVLEYLVFVYEETEKAKGKK